MTAKPVPCWTIICDACGKDAAEGSEYSGFGETQGDARDALCWNDAQWLHVGNLDLCWDHAAWSHDDDPEHHPCQSCGEYPPDELLWAANCPACWARALCAAALRGADE